MTQKEIENKISELFCNVFDEKKSSFSLTKKQSDYPGWDSFAHMNLVTELESIFSITLDMEETVGIESAKDALELIHKKLQ